MTMFNVNRDSRRRKHDVEFVVFRNEQGNPEFAIEVKKDGKVLNTHHTRDRASTPSCTTLCSRHELLDVMLPEEGIVRIHWHPDFLNKPVSERSDGHIWSARTYCARLRVAGIQAGFPSIANYDFRAKSLRTIDEIHTSSQRRRHAGHGSDDVYDRFYAPTSLGTDGQGPYAGDTPRTLLPKLLRILKVNHNLELAQTLPVRELHELVTSDMQSDEQEFGAWSAQQNLLRWISCG